MGINKQKNTDCICNKTTWLVEELGVGLYFHVAICRHIQ